MPSCLPLLPLGPEARMEKALQSAVGHTGPAPRRLAGSPKKEFQTGEARPEMKCQGYQAALGDARRDEAN